jgi:N-acetylglucosaminyl-diphospho-decaprenol L-rhamnosyltransferase
MSSPEGARQYQVGPRESGPQGTRLRPVRGPADFGIVIVSYRSRDLLEACLESLRRHPASRPTAVYVVDNSSDDGTVEMVREQFPGVDLTAAQRNLGFASATNLGIAKGSEPYVLALNPDTRLRAGVLDRLLELMDAHPEIGICGCRLERDDGSFDHAARRSFPTPLGALGHFLGIGRRDWAPRAVRQYRATDVEAGPVDAVNGAFMLIRREALDQTGLFDEGYWMYMEDLDLCYRYAQAGWTTWYEPSVAVTHVKAGTSGPVRSPRLNYAFHYGMYRFYRKHYAPARSILLNALIYIGIVVKLFVSLATSPARRRMQRA